MRWLLGVDTFLLTLDREVSAGRFNRERASRARDYLRRDREQLERI